MFDLNTKGRHACLNTNSGSFSLPNSEQDLNLSLLVNLSSNKNLNHLLLHQLETPFFTRHHASLIHSKATNQPNNFRRYSFSLLKRLLQDVLQ